ncbi:phosphatase PAP2 family protein [Marinilabiliaceae bacterium JC017]|nr:phosphatase PAP2 family protein [Marinilabiliaceae bacterium JC017]
MIVKLLNLAVFVLTFPNHLFIFNSFRGKTDSVICIQILKFVTMSRKPVGSMFHHQSLVEFVTGLLILLLAGLPLLFHYDKGDILFKLNSMGTPFLDSFFRIYTFMGYGMVMVILAVVFLFVKYYYSVLFMLILIMCGVVSFCCKELLFPGLVRPAAEIDFELLPNVIQGIDFHHYGSFPSGHTMTAFASAVVCCFYFKRRGIGLVMLLLAVLVAVSRVYLLQHFYMDVYTGAIIGTILALGVHYLLGMKLQWQEHDKLNRNLLLDISTKRKKKLTGSFWSMSFFVRREFID